MSALRRQRQEMVRHQLEARGIHDPRVLAAMEGIARHHFVPEERWDESYRPSAVPIGWGQTISQPFMVASMTQSLELVGDETILEIGTGSGYQAAILAALCERVVTVERIAPLAARAARSLDSIGIRNAHVIVADGSLGGPVHSLQFDKIIVTAAAPATPRALIDQLAPGGQLLCPVGPLEMQRMQILRRTESGLEKQEGAPCRFVPLLGFDGFPEVAQ